jgi:hypothetical protein
MTDLVESGQSIEGAKVKGDSRDPLITRGVEKNADGKVFTRYIAKFNVNSEISEECMTRIFEEAASVSSKDLIKCDRAIIRTFAKRATKNCVGPGSATHQTNFWAFPSHTNVKIECPHQELANALSRRSIITGKRVGVLK